MAMICKVKRMHFREKKSVREIVRLTSLSRNTVRKWLKASVQEEPRYRRCEAPGKITPFRDAIKLAEVFRGAAACTFRKALNRYLSARTSGAAPRRTRLHAAEAPGPGASIQLA